MSADSTAIKPPYLALPNGLAGDQCMMLDAVARQVAGDHGDYSHTKNAATEVQAFLTIAIRANARGDHGDTHAALLRAASIALGALVGLERRREESKAKVAAMHAAGAERIVALAGPGVRR